MHIAFVVSFVIKLNCYKTSDPKQKLRTILSGKRNVYIVHKVTFP